MIPQYKSYFNSGGIQSLIMYLSLFSFLCSAFFSAYLIRKKQENRRSFDLFFLLYFFYSWSFIAVTFIAPVIFGVYGANYSIRYNIVILYFALLNIGFIISYLTYVYYVKKIYLNILFGIIFICFASFVIKTTLKENPFNIFQKIKTYYPPLVKATDTFAKIYHCKNGVGNHWSARQITCLSKQNVLINTVFDNILPWQFGNNIDRYFWTDESKKQQVIYDFIVLNNFNDTTAIHQIFKTQNIKKATIDGFSFYKVPKFIFIYGTNAVKILENNDPILKN